MVLLQAREPIRRFEFARVEAGSVIADLLRLTPAILKVRGVWVCSAYPCPSCGAEAMYVQNLNPAIELEDRPTLRARLILHAKAADYSCTCGISWVNVEGVREAMTALFMQPTNLLRPVAPNPPAVH